MSRADASPLTSLPAGPAYVALAGPTASGKTAGALALADALAPHLRVEIVSVDSALVYRGMDIGTAKPTPHELARVPHHLIDIRDPLQAYSAAEFVQDAERLIADIRARGALPLLVGGTMLYFKALFDGQVDARPACGHMAYLRNAEVLAECQRFVAQIERMRQGAAHAH